MSKLLCGVSTLAVLAVGFFASAANAAPLNLISVPTSADVQSNNVSVTYSSSTKIFFATGTATQLTLFPNTVSSVPTIGSFTLTATFSSIDPSSGQPLALPSATLSVTGNSGAITYFNSSALEQFGFSTNGDIPSTTRSPQVFEFIFAPDKGLYGTSNKIGVIIATDVNDPYAASFFKAGFNNTTGNLNFSATADTYAVVPLPNAAYMGFVGLALLPLFMRRRRMA